jgi:hypothetical protein
MSTKKTKAELEVIVTRAAGLHETDRKALEAAADKERELLEDRKRDKAEIAALRLSAANRSNLPRPRTPIDPMTFTTFLAKTIVDGKKRVTDEQGHVRSVPTGEKVTRYTNKKQEKRDIRWVDTITCECGKVSEYDKQLHFYCQLGRIMNGPTAGQLWINGNIWVEDTSTKHFTSPTATDSSDPFGTSTGVDGREQQFPTGNQDPAPFRSPGALDESLNGDPVLYLTQDSSQHQPQGGIPTQSKDVKVPRT